MKVLVVDDEVTILDCLQEFLVLFGHEVVTAENGKDGLDKFLIEPNSFDAIISDVNMPYIDGIELITEIRHQQFNVPVVFVSAQRNTKSHQESAQLMPCHWLEKPFHLQQLDAVLQQLAVDQPEQASHRMPSQISEPAAPTVSEKPSLYTYSVF